MFNLSIGTCYTFWYMFFFHLFFPPGYIPFPSLLGHSPVDSQCLLAALLFLPPQMLWQPFALVPCPCCPVVQLCPWPLQPAMPSICEHVQYSQKICLMVPKDLSIGKPGRKKAELGSPGPTLKWFWRHHWCAFLRGYSKKKYLAVSHGNENELHSTVKLRLLFSSKSCLLCWIAAIILEL